MKSMVRLASCILMDIGAQHSVDTSRDQITLASRVAGEGLSFLTITLPSFEKSLLAAIEEGRISSNHFPGFRRSGGFPAFLQGFLRMMFQPGGNIREDFPPSVLRSVRQFLLAFSKVEMECTDERVLAAFKGYHETDASLQPITERQADVLGRAAWILFGEYFTDLEVALYNGDFTPRHSGGALSTRETFNQKFASERWSEKINKVFPYWDFHFVNLHHMLDCEIELDPDGSETPAKVITVPKTMKTPRIIAMEPVYNQFIQQGIFHKMTELLRNYKFLWNIVCSDSQEFNRDLARIGSISRDYATIDLNEASDRVSVSHIEALLSRHGFLLESVMACRSSEATTPLGTVRLKKFASMGSSLCFPFETILFSVIAALGCLPDFTVFTAQDLRTAFSQIRVYGDDIIVPTRSTESVIDLLQAFGLKVNANKSFWKSYFRESCGADYYKGVSVNAHKLRVEIDPSSTSTRMVEGAIHFRNFLYQEGSYHESVRYLDTVIRGIRYVPYAPPFIDGLHLYSDDPRDWKVRWNRDLHLSSYQTLRVRYKKMNDPLDGYGALRKFFLNLGDEPLSKGHLEGDGRPQCVGVNTGWSVSVL